MVRCLMSLTSGLVFSTALSMHALASQEPHGNSVESPTGSIEPSDVISDAAKHLKVLHVRLEPAPALNHVPSVIVKFDLVNDGLTSLSDIVFQVAIAEKMTLASIPRLRILAGPFTIRGKITLDPENVMTFEMRLRNLSSDCSCRAIVGIVSAQRGTP